jgi:hypothetical protein
MTCGDASSFRPFWRGNRLRIETVNRCCIMKANGRRSYAAKKWRRASRGWCRDETGTDEFGKARFDLGVCARNVFRKKLRTKWKRGRYRGYFHSVWYRRMDDLRQCLGTFSLLTVGCWWIAGFVPSKSTTRKMLQFMKPAWNLQTTPNQFGSCLILPLWKAVIPTITNGGGITTLLPITSLYQHNSSTGDTIQLCVWEHFETLSTYFDTNIRRYSSFSILSNG